MKKENFVKLVIWWKNTFPIGLLIGIVKSCDRLALSQIVDVLLMVAITFPTHRTVFAFFQVTDSTVPWSLVDLCFLDGQETQNIRNSLKQRQTLF